MILLLLSCVLGLATANQCSGILPPGLDKLSKGVDVTTIDMVPLDITSPQGFKANIIDYHCEESRQWRNPISKELYQIPDEVSMMNLPGGVMNSHVELHKTFSSVAKSRARSMGLSYASGMFSGSGSKISMTNTMTNRSRYIADVSAFHSAYRADMAPYFFGLQLSRHAKFFVSNHLPQTYLENPNKFREFINYFGTHYFVYGKFGGLMRDYIEIRSELISKMSEQQIKAEAGAAFGKMVKASGGYEGAIKSTSETFNRYSDQFIKYYGGNANFFGDPREAWQRWENSIPGNPWMFSGKLAPISNLIQDARKKGAMQTAVTEHINRGFLNEAEAHYYYLLSQSTDRNVRAGLLAELRSIARLKALPLGQLKEVPGGELEQLKRSMDRPNWFMENTRLCYYWYPDGDGGQCGGGAGRNLCAKVNTMTPYYRDDSDGRGGGCQMKWGILSDGYEQTDSWFSNAQICYQWYPDGDGGQCGGGAPRSMCAKIGQFTRYYRDDSDGRGGGCRMRWKLSIPDSAPMWVRSAKLCFEWYPDGDGGQCGGGVGRKLCAATNQWTTYYRDDTDGRGGGCQMRWGITIPI